MSLNLRGRELDNFVKRFNGFIGQELIADDRCNNNVRDISRIIQERMKAIALELLNLTFAMHPDVARENTPKIIRLTGDMLAHQRYFQELAAICQNA